MPLTGFDGRWSTWGSLMPEPTQLLGDGLCECGCGRKTTVATSSSARRGWIKGRPKRFLKGHHKRLTTPAWLEEDCGYETPCWVWQRTKNDKGYGRVWDDDRMAPAHRVYYERYVGPIPAGHQLDHLCRKPACVNPAHLEPVTPVENTRRGLRAKLSAEQVVEIKALKGMETTTSVGRRYDVAPATISDIWRGVNWNDDGDSLVRRSRRRRNAR
jgi:hypothetical protein